MAIPAALQGTVPVLVEDIFEMVFPEMTEFNPVESPMPLAVIRPLEYVLKVELVVRLLMVLLLMV